MSTTVKIMIRKGTYEFPFFDRRPRHEWYIQKLEVPEDSPVFRLAVHDADDGQRMSHSDVLHRVYHFLRTSCRLTVGRPTADARRGYVATQTQAGQWRNAAELEATFEDRGPTTYMQIASGIHGPLTPDQPTSMSYMPPLPVEFLVVPPRRFVLVGPPPPEREPW
jgi:hypothetical protein